MPVLHDDKPFQCLSCGGHDATWGRTYVLEILPSGRYHCPACGRVFGRSELERQREIEALHASLTPDAIINGLFDPYGHKP